MKKFGLLLITLLAFGTGNVLGQVSQDVTVAAEVNAQLSFNLITNVDFGAIQQLAASLNRESADPNNPEGNNLGSAAQLGVVDVSGTNGQSIVVDYSDAIISNGTEDITFTTEIRDATNNANVTSGDQVTLDGTTGNVTLHIGGSIPAPTGTGTYNTSSGGGAPLTVTVQYL